MRRVLRTAISRCLVAAVVMTAVQLIGVHSPPDEIAPCGAQYPGHQCWVIAQPTKGTP